MEKISAKELVEAVAAGTGQSKKTVKEILDNAALNISGYVGNGTEVTFANLGKFCPSDRASRTCNSPVTKGVSIEVPARRVLAFKPSASMKDLQN